MSYTKIAKPTSTSYTNTNPSGREQYDQATILYDDPNVFYDGVNQNLYTKVSKPASFGYDIPWSDMLMAWSEATGEWGAGSSYTKVPKPTT